MRIYFSLLCCLLLLFACGEPTTTSVDETPTATSRPKGIMAPAQPEAAADSKFNGWTEVSQYMRQQYYRGTTVVNGEQRKAIYKFTQPGRGIRQTFWQADGNENCDVKQSFRWTLDPLDADAGSYTLLVEPSVVQQIGSECPSSQAMPVAFSAGLNEPLRVPVKFAGEKVTIESWGN